MFFRRKEVGPHECSICGADDAAFRSIDGWICRTCLPVDRCVDSLTVDDVRGMHIRDPELLERIEIFEETDAHADLRFDEGHRLFFKGTYVNRTIPILSYSEIHDYKILIDGRAIAFNSVDGQRSVFRVRTDEYITKVSKDITDIVLEVGSSRSNVKVRSYVIRSMKIRVCDSRSDCLRFAMDVSDKFDRIVEDNIIANNNAD